MRHESCNVKVGSGTVAREENCHPHNCLLDDGPRIIAPPPQDNNCPRREIVLWTIASRKIATPSLIAPQENCPLTIKFSSKIVAPTQATSPQRVLEYPKWTEENYGLSTNTIIKESLYRKLFFKMQIRNKKLFTFIYFSQILTKPCKTQLIREQLSLYASWFSYSRTQKNTILWKKWFGKKIQKKLQSK